ncbi:MAG: hypothetical protein ACJ75B_16675 [Flavisolibacter sp.]
MLKVRLCSKKFLAVLFIFFSITSFAQDNSPYSRYGLGDMTPQTNITTRGMGSVSAAYADSLGLSINFENPASYSQFLAVREARSKKLQYGRVILDVGLNFSNRTLITPNTPDRFTASDGYFSYLQVGLPLKKNWGLSFGLRPLSRISYMINKYERLTDPITALPIDSALTEFRGTGGSYLPTIGTGFAIGNLSLGLNFGYLFGTKATTTYRSFINDSVVYYSSDHTTSTSFGNTFFNAGLLYKIKFNKNTLLRVGVTGNWQQTIKASQNILRQTFTRGAAGDELRIDSVFEQNNVKGEIIYPAMYKVGLALEHSKSDLSGWLIEADVNQSKWNDYRYFGAVDSVKDNMQLHVGIEIRPRAKENYFSHVAYRFGFYGGNDYINIEDKLPVYGASFGLGLPIRNFNRLSPGQFTMLNLALEYGKRGNDNNLLKENLFRFSASFNLSDLWFGKKKYD